MTISADALPHGWTVAILPELIGSDGDFSDGDWVETKDQDPEGDVRLIQLADVGEGVFRNRSNRFLTSLKAAELNCTFLRPGDVIVARMPDPLGRACIFPGTPMKSVTAVDVCIVRPGNGSVEPRWLMWTINAPQFRQAIAGLQSGTTRGRISRKNLGTIPLPVPPLPEQRRIVAAIEEQLSRIDAGASALQRARRNLQRMRAAVLRAAVTGRLVREDNNGRPAAMSPLNEESRDGEVSLPSGWRVARVPDVAAVVSGQTPKDIQSVPGGGIPFYRVADMNEAEGHLMRDARVYLDATAVKRLRLKVHPPGTVIFPKRGGAIATNKKRVLTKPSAFDLNIMGLIPQAIDTGYLYLWLSTVDLQVLWDGSNVPQINHDDIARLMVPVPPAPEQRRIVAESSRLLSQVDALDRALDGAETSSRRLRRAVLVAAYQGRLVSQDPSDEPAFTLLDRIKAARGVDIPSVRPEER